MIDIACHLLSPPLSCSPLLVCPPPGLHASLSPLSSSRFLASSPSSLLGCGWIVKNITSCPFFTSFFFTAMKSQGKMWRCLKHRANSTPCPIKHNKITSFVVWVSRPAYPCSRYCIMACIRWHVVLQSCINPTTSATNKDIIVVEIKSSLIKTAVDTPKWLSLVNCTIYHSHFVSYTPLHMYKTSLTRLLKRDPQRHPRHRIIIEVASRLCCLWWRRISFIVYLICWSSAWCPISLICNEWMSSLKRWNYNYVNLHVSPSKNIFKFIHLEAPPSEKVPDPCLHVMGLLQLYM